MQIKVYEHECKYYETDQMGVVHHSNYIRFMEEARIDFLDQIGFPMDVIEAGGVVSPVVGINCQYKNMSYFKDILCIKVFIKEYSGVRFSIGYEMADKKTGQLRAVGESSHCFLTKDGKIVMLKKVMPELDLTFREFAKAEK
ncbi:MAG: acyl-CoA thioesterase [Lachnospiraceae bacterium]|nr:acyl-CoA thioesterase [Lachnospiraceae bacterium]